eukprot:SAG11_NODE_33750_length_275_cov_1.181818_1_plen_91_part_11
MARIGCMDAQAYFPPWLNSTTKPQVACDREELANITAYGAGWMHDFAPLLASKRLGVFLTACVAHEERGTASWTTLSVQDTILRDAFEIWH